jgi:hypothetical protein
MDLVKLNQFLMPNNVVWAAAWFLQEFLHASGLASLWWQVEFCKTKIGYNKVASLSATCYIGLLALELVI